MQKRGPCKTQRFRCGEIRTAKGDQIMRRKIIFIVMGTANVY